MWGLADVTAAAVEDWQIMKKGKKTNATLLDGVTCNNAC